MSYKPQGASLPGHFKKSVNTSFKQQPRDRLVVIDSYDIPNKTIKATELDTDRKIEVQINPEKLSVRTRSATDKWNGNVIDERMEKFLPVGSTIILDACETVKKIKKGNTELSQMICNWIVNPPEQSPEKTFKACYTVNSYNERIVGFQVWDKKAINPASDEGEVEINELSEKLDQINIDFKQNLRPVGIGVRFRTLVASAEKEGEYEVVDTSPPFDWIRAEEDGEGNIIKEGHPLDREHLEMYLNGYLDYVFGSETDEPDAPRGLIADGVVPDKTKMTVEVLTYKAYAAAPMSEKMSIKNSRHPLARLANVVLKFGQNDEQGYIGKNWGVDGIICLTGDESPKNRGDEWKQRNLVSNAFTNGYSANILSLIRSADDKKVFVHPSLDRVKEYKTPQADSQVHQDIPSLTAAPETDFSETDFDTNVGPNYFDMATQQSLTTNEETEAPVVEQTEKKTAKDRFSRNKTSV